jgi:stringent starvation protein B
MEQTSTRPYLLRAFYEWITDNQLTPHLLVNAEHSSLSVPKHYISDGKIVLNISATAVRDLVIDNNVVTFSARFDGRPYDIVLPVNAIKAIYAQENGKGMMFPDEELEEPESGGANRPKKPDLKLVE